MAGVFYGNISGQYEGSDDSQQNQDAGKYVKRLLVKEVTKAGDVLRQLGHNLLLRSFFGKHDGGLQTQMQNTRKDAVLGFR